MEIKIVQSEHRKLMKDDLPAFFDEIFPLRGQDRSPGLLGFSSRHVSRARRLARQQNEAVMWRSSENYGGHGI